ncbi:MAG: M16 family metallopeptidase [Flavipsychrobacter sp.]
MVLDRKTPPRIHDAIEFEYKLPPITEAKLDNGLPLYWLNAGVQDVAEIDWVFPAGIWYEQKQSIAQAVAGLIKNGTSKRTAHQIHEALEFYGANLKVSTGNDFSTITLYSLTKHLPQLLPIVYEIITDATFPQEEVEIHKRNAMDRLMVSLRQCDFVANQRIDALLFGEQHPYGRYSKKETIEAITREDLVAFYKSHYDLSRVKTFLSGNVGAAEVKSLNEVFGKAAISANPLSQPSYSIQEAPEKKHNLLNDPNGVQGAIRIGRIFPNRHHPDFAPMVVLNTLFGGYFGSRLMSNIREDKGYTYGIYSSMSPFINSGSLIIHTEAGRDVLEAAVKEIYHEMDVLCSEKAGEEEILLVKNYLLGNMLGDLDGPFSIMQRWRTLILNDMTEANFNRNVQVYKSITADELLVLAQKYLRSNDYHEIVVV